MNASDATLRERSFAAGGLPDDANPFATRFTRPRAAEFLFPAGLDAGALVTRLAEHTWRGQIVGPHGTGKSTLIAALWPRFTAAGRNVVFHQLREGERKLPFTAAERQAWSKSTLVVMDGYEQLSFWSRWRLKAAVRRAGCGLLVTSHANAGLPELWHSAVSSELACEFVARLQAGHAVLVFDDDVRRALAEKNGNFREALFALYDLYETRRRAGTEETK